MGGGGGGETERKESGRATSALAFAERSRPLRAWNSIVVFGVFDSGGGLARRPNERPHAPPHRPQAIPTSADAARADPEAAVIRAPDGRVGGYV